MRRTEIHPGFYEVVTRRGKRNTIRETEVMRVVAEPTWWEPRVSWMNGYWNVPCQRAQLQGLYGQEFALGDIRRRVEGNPDELAKWEKDFETAARLGWVHVQDHERAHARSVEFEVLRQDAERPVLYHDNGGEHYPADDDA